MADYSIKAIIKAVDQFTAPVRGMIGTAQQFGKTATRMGRSLSFGLTAPIVAFGVMAGAASLKFDQAMNNVAAVTRAPADQLRSMRDLAKQLGSSTQFSASQAASGMEFLGRAGWKTNQILAGTPALLSLAAATSSDLGFAADVASNIMGAFNIQATEAGRVADILSATTASANVDITMLAEGFKSAGPVAKLFGMSLEQTSAALGLLGNIGIQGAEGGTALRNSMLRLAAPASDASKMLAALGVKTTDAKGNMRAYADIVTDFGKRIEKLGSGTQIQAMNTLFGVRTVAGASELIKQAKSGALQEYAHQLENVTGRADEMAAVMNKGAPGAIKAFLSAFEGLQLAFADSGVSEFVTKIINTMTVFIQKLSHANPAVLKFIAAVAGFAAVLGPVILALGLVATAVAAISLPMILITAGIIALGAAIVAVVVYWDDIKAAASGALSTIVGWAETAYKAVKPLIDAIGWVIKHSPAGLMVQAGMKVASLVSGGGNSGAAAGAPPGVAARSAAAQSGGAQSVNGQMVVRFDNAPPGMRVESTKTNSPGMSLDADVGHNMAAVQ